MVTYCICAVQEETTAGQKDSVFERLLRNLGDRFGDDYPFYLILAHQVQQLSLGLGT